MSLKNILVAKTNPIAFTLLQNSSGTHFFIDVTDLRHTTFWRDAGHQVFLDGLLCGTENWLN